MKGLLVHVAADSRDPGVVAPIFPDGSFEYIPVEEEDFELKTKLKTYYDIPARNTPYGKVLADFLPNDIAEMPVHLDPNFENFTYGEPVEERPRYYAFTRLNEGDVIFFIASLAPYDPKVYERRDKPLRKYQLHKYQVGKKNEYVIGFFKVSGIAKVHVRNSEGGRAETFEGGKYEIEIEPLVGRVSEEDVKGNWHYKRCMGYSEEYKERFLIIKGEPKASALLSRAVRLTDGYEKYTFKLNELGREILKKETDILRGARRIDEEAVERLVEEISKHNKELEGKLKEIVH